MWRVTDTKVPPNGPLAVTFGTICPKGGLWGDHVRFDISPASRQIDRCLDFPSRNNIRHLFNNHVISKVPFPSSSPSYSFLSDNKINSVYHSRVALTSSVKWLPEELNDPWKTKFSLIHGFTNNFEGNFSPNINISDSPWESRPP